MLDWWTARLGQLRSFYFKVADARDARNSVETTPHAPDPLRTLELPDETADEEMYEDRVDLLPVNWQAVCLAHSGKVPGAFLTQMIDWFCAMEALGDVTRTVSVLELICLCVQDVDFHFPVLASGNSQWHMRSISSLFAKPTVASLLRPFVSMLRDLHELFPQAMFQAQPQAWPDLGVYIRFPSLKLKVPETLAKEARQLLLKFTGSRKVRRTCDLARPLQ